MEDGGVVGGVVEIGKMATVGGVDDPDKSKVNLPITLVVDDAGKTNVPCLIRFQIQLTIN